MWQSLRFIAVTVAGIKSVAGSQEMDNDSNGPKSLSATVKRFVTIDPVRKTAARMMPVKIFNVAITKIHCSNGSWNKIGSWKPGDGQRLQWSQIVVRNCKTVCYNRS